jgi:hypothetical protein
VHHALQNKFADNFCDGKDASSDEAADANDGASRLYKHFTPRSNFLSNISPEHAKIESKRV